MKKFESNGSVVFQEKEAVVADKRFSLTESKYFCMLPWTHVCVMPSGTVLPCCISREDKGLGSLRNQSLYEIWNGRNLRRMRQNMLADRGSVNCKRCYEQERNGILSARKDANVKLAHHWPIVETTKENGAVEKLNLPFIDVRFSNICNFRCRTCSANFSSGWYKDQSSLYQSQVTEILRPTRDPKELWEQIAPLIPSLEKIYFCGGEPLLMEEHYAILELLLQHGKTDVQIQYNTNFSVTGFRDKDVFSLWKHFSRVEVGASIDAMEERGEYLRKGMRWERIVANRRRMMEECPAVRFYVSATIGVLNALHFPDLHREWVGLGLIKPEDVYINILHAPAHFRIQIFPERMKQRIVRKYTAHMEWLKGLGVTPSLEKSLLESFSKVLDFMTAEDRSSELPTFLDKTKALDALRGENCFRTFPELQDLAPARGLARLWGVISRARADI